MVNEAKNRKITIHTGDFSFYIVRLPAICEPIFIQVVRLFLFWRYEPLHSRTGIWLHWQSPVRQAFHSSAARYRRKPHSELKPRWDQYKKRRLRPRGA